MRKQPDLVAQLTPTRRIVADELQWIVQDLSGKRWEAIAFCRDRDLMLERFVPRDTAPGAWEALKALPAIRGWVAPNLDATPVPADELPGFSDTLHQWPDRDGQSDPNAVLSNGLINGIFESLEQRDAYRRALRLAARTAPAIANIANRTAAAHGTNPDGSTPGALQGDDYPLTYDADGFPEFPACLDRRKPRLEEAA
jgi:hypothetical protein